MKAAEKIIEGITQLLDGYIELQESLEEEYGSSAGEESADREDEDLNLEVEAALVNELRAALEAVMDTEDLTSAQVASLISHFSDALEEIDPDAFEQDSSEDQSVYAEDVDDEEEYYDEDLDDLDYDDEDLEEDEGDDDEEDELEEEEDDD